MGNEPMNQTHCIGKFPIGSNPIRILPYSFDLKGASIVQLYSCPFQALSNISFLIFYLCSSAQQLFAVILLPDWLAMFYILATLCHFLPDCLAMFVDTLSARCYFLPEFLAMFLCILGAWYHFLLDCLALFLSILAGLYQNMRFRLLNVIIYLTCYK